MSSDAVYEFLRLQFDLEKFWVLDDDVTFPEDAGRDWPEYFDPGSTEVAPGVRVKLLSTGDHYHQGETVWGAMISVQDSTATCDKRQED